MTDIISWNEELVSLGEVVDWSSVKVGDVIKVDLSNTGLTDAADPILPLYMRNMCLKLCRALEENKMQVVMISGCPGVGKSVEVYSYAMWHASKNKKRVLYIHCDELQGFSIMFKSTADQNKMELGSKPYTSETKVLEDYIIKLLDDKKVDLIVLDGALKLLIRRVYIAMIKFKTVMLMTCTSFRGCGKMSPELRVKTAELMRFEMESWTEAEYKAAIAAGALKFPKRELGERFYYAGGSVRFIQQPIGSLISILQEKIAQVPDMNKLIGTGGVGEASDVAVNSLMAVYDGKKVILSKYVSRMLRDQVSDDWIAKARLTLQDNPVWQGWVSEFEVLTLAQKGELFFNRQNTTADFQWISDRAMQTFDDANDENLKNPKLLGWFQPSKWNHACFDALYRVSRDKIRAVQITDADCHSCKLKYLIAYVKTMKVSEVDYVVVCRKKNFNSFKVFDPMTTTNAKEKDQYKLLLEALNEVLIENSGTQKRKRTQQAKMSFQKVCYEK